MPREASLPIPLTCIDVTRAASTSLDVMLEKSMDDYWNVDGGRDLSDTWTGFTRVTLLDEKTTGWICMVRGATDKEATSRPDSLWLEIWKDMPEASKRKEKQKWAIEKPKLDNAGKLRGIYFIDPADEEFKETNQNARRKLEVPMSAAMPCKTRGREYRETCGAPGLCKSEYARIVEADESIYEKACGRDSTYRS